MGPGLKVPAIHNYMFISLFQVSPWKQDQCSPQRSVLLWSAVSHVSAELKQQIPNIFSLGENLSFYSKPSLFDGNSIFLLVKRRVSSQKWLFHPSTCSYPALQKKNVPFCYFRCTLCSKVIAVLESQLQDR